MTGHGGSDDRARRRAGIFWAALSGGKARAQALRLRYLRAVALRKVPPMTHPASIVTTTGSTRCQNCGPSCSGRVEIHELRRRGGTNQRRGCTVCPKCVIFVRVVPPTIGGRR